MLLKDAKNQAKNENDDDDSAKKMLAKVDGIKPFDSGFQPFWAPGPQTLLEKDDAL